MIVEKLLEYQQQHDLTDQQMADRLGVARQTWNFIRRGKYHAGLDRFYVQAAKRFPELQGYLLLHTQQHQQAS